LDAPIGCGRHDLLRDRIAARELQPVLLKAQKILAEAGARRGLRLLRAARSVSLALFDFLGNRRRHPFAVLSQFDPEANDNSVRQPFRVALMRGPAKFDDAVGDHLADGVGIVGAMKHGEDGVERVAKDFGTDIIENGADCHGATRACAYCHYA
jgi:hypothetical protein